MPPDTSSDADVAAVVEAFSTVIDLDASFQTKAPHLEAAELLRPSLDEYARRVRPFASRIGVQVVAVDVEGGQATFAYDLVTPDGKVLVAGLVGEAYRSEGLWVVTKTSFCSTMARIAIGCPI